jgi:putative sulfotransferase
MYSPWILENYPEAKIVYLTREQKATAKSMARHSSFQLAQLQVEARAKYGIDPFDTEYSDELPAEVVQFLPGHLTAEFLRKRGDDLNRFVALCAFMTSQAEQALADHLPVHLHKMTYEELLMDPIGQLTSLAEFLGFAEPAEWAVSVAGRVRSPQGVTA